MSLILRQEQANAIPTPPAGKGTLYINTVDQLTTKSANGAIQTFPTLGGSNTQMLYNDQSSIQGSANLTFDNTSNTLTLLGNLVATGVKTSNLYYANGNPWDLQQPAGSNTQLQFNNNNDFGASANLTFNTATNDLTLTNGNVAAAGVKTDNIYYANGQPWDMQQPQGSNTAVQFNDSDSFGGSANFTFNKSTNLLTVTGNITGTNVNAGNLLTANYISGTVTTAAQPNITSVGTLSSLVTSGNLTVGGNLTVNGNVTYINVETFDVEDPIITIGGGPNGNALISNDGKDRGTALDYYTTAPVTAFMGWDNSNAEFAFGSNVNIANELVSYNTLGNVRAGNFIGALTGAATTAGTVTTNAQPNITSVGKMTSLVIGASADLANDYPNTLLLSSQSNTGGYVEAYTGIVGEASANLASNIASIGVFGIGQSNGSVRGTGLQGEGAVTNTGDTGATVGVRGYAVTTHSGGYNIGVLGNAIGSGVANYAFYIQNGGIGSLENVVAWDLHDNDAAALTFNSTGKANIFAIETTDNAEGIFTSGYLNVTGNITAAGIKTNNYYYANGSPVDFQQAGGSNTQVQFNDDDSFGGSANFTFNKSTNVLAINGNVSATTFTGALSGAATTAGTVTTNAQPNITSVGTLTSLTVTGNVTGGNLNTAGNVNSSIMVNGGTGLYLASGPSGYINFFTTGGDKASISDTGNIIASNLIANSTVFATTANISGNVNAGNVSATTFTGALSGAATTAGTVTTAAQGNITSVGTLTGLGVNGTVTAANITANTGVFTGNGSGLSAIAGANVSGAVSFATTANAVAGANVSGTVATATTAGTVTTNAQPNITSTGTLTALSVTGNISAGNVSAATFTGALTGNATGSAATVTTNAQPNITSTGTLTALTVTGNITGGNLLTAGYVAAEDGLLSITAFTGTLSDGIVIDYAHPYGRFSTSSNDGYKFYNAGLANVELVSISLSGDMVANANITANANVTATANVITNNILGRTGAVTITSAGTNTNINLAPNGTGNITANSTNITNVKDPINDQDAATKKYVDNFASTGISYHQPVAVATTTTLATTTGGTMTYNNGASGVGANLVTTGTFLLIDGANVQTAGTRILVKNEANAAWNGIYQYTSTTVITRTTDADEYGADSTTQLSINDYFFVTGGTANEGSAFIVSAPAGTITFGTSNITFATFSTSQVYDAGTGLTLANTTFSITNTAVTTGSFGSADAVATFTVNQQGQLTAASNTVIQANAANLSGTVLKSTVVTSSLTSVGTLGSLAVTGNISGANITATHYGAATGLTSIPGGNVTGTVANATYAVSAGTAGTVTTAAQGNITSVGTLTGLGVNGTATAVAFTANTGVFTGNGNGLSSLVGANVTGTVSSATTAGTVTTAAQGNITSVGTLTSLAVTGNISGANITATHYGAATGLTSIPGGNVTGTVANATYAVSAGTATTAGSVTTAAQGNITSVGTLTGLTVSSTIVGSVNGSAGSAATAGTVTTAAQPNITSVGTLTSLTLGGTLTGAVQIGTGTATHYGTTLTTGANTTAGSIVGTWTLSPGSKFNATYADLAEKYVSDAQYAPGTVLVFGGEFEVTQANSFDSTAVAGVVSTNPAYLMNAGCEGEFTVELALMGRVPVKVCGPVKKGDLMVTSDQAGFAKANNAARAGSIIGKALQSCNTATGIIEVLVGKS